MRWMRGIMPGSKLNKYAEQCYNPPEQSADIKVPACYMKE